MNKKQFIQWNSFINRRSDCALQKRRRPHYQGANNMATQVATLHAVRTWFTGLDLVEFPLAIIRSRYFEKKLISNWWRPQSIKANWTDSFPGTGDRQRPYRRLMGALQKSQLCSKVLNQNRCLLSLWPLSNIEKQSFLIFLICSNRCLSEKFNGRSELLESDWSKNSAETFDKPWPFWQKKNLGSKLF